MLTNKPRSFQKTSVLETGISDHHKLIATLFRSKFTHLPPKKVKYRDYKKFDNYSFLHELEEELLKGEMYKSNKDMYTVFTNVFSSVVNKHAPLKSRTIRGNQGPFMNRELSKAIMKRSRMKNRYLKWPSWENFLNYTASKRLCNNLTKATKVDYFKKVTNNRGKSFVSNKSFWNTVKPFLTNKGFMTEDKIVIKNDDKIITEAEEISELFNNHYVNVVEKTTGFPSVALGLPNDQKQDHKTVKSIIDEYCNHPSILRIKEKFPLRQDFDIPLATVSQINRLISEINIKKATGPDNIHPRLVKLSANIIDSHLTNIINRDISSNHFSDNAKIAPVIPILKKNERDLLENYRPVSILCCFSKIYEKFLLDKIKPFIDTFLSRYMSAYRENHSTNHVLIRLTESWRNALDNNKLVGTVFMDLSKAFDCIPHDLLVAKLYMYGFSEHSITFFYSYLKRRVQCVKINEICSTSKTLLSEVPQGSILGPILFNIFLNDMITIFNKTDIYNFADDNTLSVIAENRDEILNVLCQESELAVNWFKENSMIVNPDKFQSMILDKQDKNNISSELNISGNKIKTKESVKLLGISIDNQLKFDTHVSNLCKQASMQLNAISRLKQYMGRKEIEVLLNSFIYSNFNYCPLVWNFCSCKSSSKIEQIQKRCLKLLLDDNVSDYNDLLHKSNRSTMVVK